MSHQYLPRPSLGAAAAATTNPSASRVGEGNPVQALQKRLIAHIGLSHDGLVDRAQRCHEPTDMGIQNLACICSEATKLVGRDGGSLAEESLRHSMRAWPSPARFVIV